MPGSTLGALIRQKVRWLDLEDRVFVVTSAKTSRAKAAFLRGADAFLATFHTHSNALCVLVGAGDYSRENDSNFLNLINRTTLAELTDILRRASFVVSVDSGPMHLAAALGTPLLSIHTWSDPRRVGPFSEKAWIWQGGKIRSQNLTTAPLPEKRFTPNDANEAAKLAALAVLSATQR
jgi:ADP-heptose:LPS heptosyltransferase